MPTAASGFALPGNLYLIGTMNTADRSIALVDLALRRRFHFVEFPPRQAAGPRDCCGAGWTRTRPTWRGSPKSWDRANEKLDDRQAAIGPSYFMKPDLDNEMVDLIWEHNVLPYVEERFLRGTRPPRGVPSRQAPR